MQRKQIDLNKTVQYNAQIFVLWSLKLPGPAKKSVEKKHFSRTQYLVNIAAFLFSCACLLVSGSIYSGMIALALSTAHIIMPILMVMAALGFIATGFHLFLNGQNEDRFCIALGVATLALLATPPLMALVGLGGALLITSPYVLLINFAIGKVLACLEVEPPPPPPTRQQISACARALLAQNERMEPPLPSSPPICPAIPGTSTLSTNVSAVVSGSSGLRHSP